MNRTIAGDHHLWTVYNDQEFDFIMTLIYGEDWRVTRTPHQTRLDAKQFNWTRAFHLELDLLRLDTRYERA